MKWDSSTIVLIVAGVLWIAWLCLLCFGIAAEEGKAPDTAPPVPLTQPNPICNVRGVPPQQQSIPYQRLSAYSNGNPYATDKPSWVNIQHPVPRLTRLRSLGYPVSPNHWLGSAMYGTDNLIMCYPYLLNIRDQDLSWGWPSTGTLQEICTNPPCSVGQEQLVYSSTGDFLTIGCANQIPVACDIVNVDALCATINWQYKNPNNQIVTAFQALLCQGCPYLTLNNLSSPITIDGITEVQKTDYGYLLNQQYVLFLPDGVIITQQHGSLYQLPPLQGYIRIAHYQNNDELAILIANNGLIPKESQVNVTTAAQSGTVAVDLTYAFILATMNNSDNNNFLMMKLPHQQLVSYSNLGQFSHPLLGPYRLITTPDNSWHISETIPDYPLDYPKISNSSLLTAYQADVTNVLNLPYPGQPVPYLAWLGSLANLIVIGKSLDQNVTDLITLLATELGKISTDNGILTNNIAFTYDQEWGGTTTNLGITNCQGTVDDGNAYYQNHIGHHGYLLYAYAIAAANGVTIDQSKALYFVRSLMNPSTTDNYFPLWRHKHWYLGYSLETGLQPSTTKATENIAAVVAGYYGAYLLGKALNNNELMKWSAALLATEISSAQTNFQFGSFNAIQVDPKFVQGTITARGDNYYAYVTDNDQSFPQLNAAMAIPMTRPILGYSNNYINKDWATDFRPYVTAGLVTNVEPETLAYGSVVAANSSNYQSIVNRLVSNATTPLPYGDTWSSVIHWILTNYS